MDVLRRCRLNMAPMILIYTWQTLIQIRTNLYNGPLLCHLIMMAEQFKLYFTGSLIQRQAIQWCGDCKGEHTPIAMQLIRRGARRKM